MPKKFTSFFNVKKSPWPLIVSINSFMLFISMIIFLKNKNLIFLMFSLSLLLFSSALWFRDMYREGVLLGFHTKKIKYMIMLGMVLFILSEIMLFFSFFWSYFHFSLSTDVETGLQWPPKGVNFFKPYNIPLLNSLLLLSSGVTITWAHFSFKKKYFNTKLLVIITILLGAYFTLLQLYEYKMAQFTMADGSFGSIFFLMTGFHGVHVIIGSLFLLYNLYRMTNNSFSKTRHISFELSIWYWHFVDVVWLGLYLSLYWWIS